MRRRRQESRARSKVVFFLFIWVLGFLLPPYTEASHVSDPDLNNDTIVDNADLNIIKASFGKKCGAAGFNALADINHDCIVNLLDLTYVSSQFGKTFPVDIIPPTISIAPAEGTMVNTTTPLITISYSDAGSGLNLATYATKIDGVDITGLFVVTATGATYTTPLSEGLHTVEASIRDHAGNQATVTSTFTVIPPVVLSSRPLAIPPVGDAPLTVRFIPEFVTDNAVERFQWDFDGNGIFDRTEVIGTNQTFTYRTPGRYNVLLRITDSKGDQNDGIVVVNVGNKPPEITAEATPSNGQIPLAVNFSATATDNEGIARYEWDFEGDGIYDSSSPASGSVSFTYTQAGTFQASVRVTDSLGVSATKALPTTQVRPAPLGSPSVRALANRSSGPVQLLVNFSATATDPDGQAFTNWSWDFNGDGVVDFNSPTGGNASFTFSIPGTYFARVRVTSVDGKTAEDVIQIVAQPQLTLSLSQDTIDPNLGESVSVRTVLGGETRVSVVIEDRNSRTVRTLVPWVLRSAGTYNDPWSGLDDTGIQAKEGEYYAVLLYDVDGVVRRVDLRETSGGAQFNPPRSLLPSRFQPFAGSPLSITFTLSRASEVTAFMGRFFTNTRLVTFFDRKPLGRGSHTIVWNGENGDGQLMHPPSGDQFLFGIFGFTLSDNAVYVRSGANITGLRASPSIFDPNGHEPGMLTFNLSKAADVELIVADAVSGAELTRIRYTGRPSGANTIHWDGKTREGAFVAPGRYRLGLTAIDASGLRSMTIYTVQRVYY